MIQRDNVKAAIEWHKQFPPDEFVLKENVCFQNGQRIEKSEVNLSNGVTWERSKQYLLGIVFFDIG